jgi:hypothetical protein
MLLIQMVLVAAGFAGLMWAMIAWMIRANNRERDAIQRRRQEWIANGGHPDEEPNFFTGSGGGPGGG